MATKRGKAPTSPVEVVPRGYASQEGADVNLAPAELTAAQVARRRSDRARAESAGVLGPLRAEDLDIAPDVDVDALEDDRRKRESWERKKREMAAQKASRLASQGRIPPIAGHMEQVIEGIFGAADERGPVSAEDEPRLEVEELLDEMMESWFSPVGDPLSPMTPFGERLQIMKEAEERVLSKREEDFRKAEELERSMEEQPITEEVHGDAREEVERDFMEDYPDLEDAALAVGSADDSAPRFAAAIDGATDITEDDVSDGTVIQFTDSNGQRQQWVYDGRDDTLFRDTTFPSGQ